MLGLGAAAALVVGLAFGAGRAEAASVEIIVTNYAGGASDIADALADQEAFHAGYAWSASEDFEGFVANTDVTPLQTNVGTFTSIGDVHTTGTTGLVPHDEAHIRDGDESVAPNGSRYDTSGGENYLDSNDNGGIRLEIPGSSGVGSFDRLSLLATDVDDVATANFSIAALGSDVPMTTTLAGALGKFPNGTLHLITFLFKDGPVSNIGIDFTIDVNDGFGLDSVVLSAVPLPPAALLFLSGLAGLGLVARRRRARLGPAA